MQLLRCFHLHSDRTQCHTKEFMSIAQWKNNECIQTRHSSDCKNYTDLDIFQKKQKEARQLIAIQQSGVLLKVSSQIRMETCTLEISYLKSFNIDIICPFYDKLLPASSGRIQILLVWPNNMSSRDWKEHRIWFTGFWIDSDGSFISYFRYLWTASHRHWM